MIANSKKHILSEHLLAVANTAKQIAAICGYDKYVQQCAFNAGLLHDIGKAVTSIQNYFQSNIIDEESISPLHHEISWAFLHNEIGISNANDLILNAIYWHHARPLNEKYEYLKSRDEILEKVKQSDLKILKKLFQDLNPDGIDIHPINRDYEVPALFDDDRTCSKKNNSEYLAVRMCLISADRTISALSDETIKEIAHGKPLQLNSTKKENHHAIKCPDCYTPERFEIQYNCAKEIPENTTTIIKAPAGFGKTLIGVLYSRIRGKRAYWVCPRNVVAETVYENITRELKIINSPGSVELFLTGQRKKATTAEGEVPVFESDIVVTNIDNLLGPMVNNRTADKLFSILSEVVILDEFHEFAGDSPLFAAFITYMRARHQLSSNASTLLLSATPTNMYKLWDTETKQTIILPDAEHHYPAAHNNGYSLHFIEELPMQLKPASLSIFNSIKMSQDHHLNYKTDHLIHSKYIDEDREKILNTIYTSFGKGGDGVETGKTISSALVIQAAMDISVQNLYDSVCSPESTLQRIGRCNRWGNIENAEIYLFCPDLKTFKSELMAVRTIYDTSLRDNWIEFIQKKSQDKVTVTLKDIYDIYNDFYCEHEKDVWGYLRELYKTGITYLKGYAPIKLLEKKPGEKANTGKSLRNPNGSFFFSVKINGTKNDWLKPEQVMDEGIELYHRFSGKADFNRELIDASKMLPRLNSLHCAGYYKYKRMVKENRIPRSLDQWFRIARNPETPIPDFTRIYDKKIGLTSSHQEAQHD